MTRGTAMTRSRGALHRSAARSWRAYLRSLFQAEGYVSQRERPAAVLRSTWCREGIVRGVQQLLARFGIFARELQERQAGGTVAPCAARTAGRRRQGRRLAPGRRRRRDPAPAGVPGCGRRYTTYERVEELPLLVVKRSGATEPFDRAKLGRASSARSPAARSTTAAIDALADEVEEEVRAPGPEVASERVGLAVLERLRQPRPGLLPALRLGLQGLRGPRRLRARGRRAPEDDRAQAAVRHADQSEVVSAVLVRNPCNDTRVILRAVIATTISRSAGALDHNILWFDAARAGWSEARTDVAALDADSVRRGRRTHGTGAGAGRHRHPPALHEPGVHPYDTVEWERRDAGIPNYKDGTDAF